MSSELSYFETICAQLNTNPAEATRKLIEFRENAESLGISLQILQQTTNQNVQFQSLLVLQHAALKNWDIIAAQDRDILKSTLWMLVTSNSRNLPIFSVNKTLQLFVLLWKREWTVLDVDAKRSLFSEISKCLQNGTDIRLGVNLLRIFTEEFSGRGSAEIGLPIEFHRLAYLSFEKYGINETFQLCIQALSSTVSMCATLRNPSTVNNTDQLYQYTSTCTEVMKLLNELIHWEFGG